MISFTIITPTLLRESVKETINSIKSQDYYDVQHIIITDGRPDSAKKESVLVWIYENLPATGLVLEFPNGFKDFGNTPRHVAWYFARGEYIMYLDDDDEHLKDSLKILSNAIEEAGRPDWGVFPAYRLGSRFMDNPPGLCHTVSCQWFHKKHIKEQRVQWPEGQVGNYLSDGEFLESVKKLQPEYAFFDKLPDLCRVNKIGEGIYKDE